MNGEALLTPINYTKNINNKKIKFAVVGCGHIGQRHAAIIQNNAESELIALCDILPKEKISGKEQFNAVPLYKTIEDLLQAHPEIDVVIVASPNGLHEAQALTALKAHKHVVIEKPMALTKAGCEKIIYMALQNAKQVFCVMQNRYSPPSVWLKEILSAGILGKIFMVQINCYWNRDDRYYKPNSETGRPETWHGTKELDGGTLFTQFSHFIDLMYWCFGDIKNIQAKLNNFMHKKSTDFEDSGFVNFDFVGGGMGALNYSTAVWDKNLESSITIVAENGSVKIGGQYMDNVETCHIKNYIMPELTDTHSSKNFGIYKGAAMNHNLFLENVIQVLKGRDTIRVNALEGLKVVELIERIYGSN